VPTHHHHAYQSSQWVMHEPFATFLPNFGRDIEQVTHVYPTGEPPGALASSTLLLNNANNLTMTPLDGILPHGWKPFQDFMGWRGLGIAAERGPAELRGRARRTASSSASQRRWAAGTPCSSQGPSRDPPAAPPPFLPRASSLPQPGGGGTLRACKLTRSARHSH